MALALCLTLLPAAALAAEEHQHCLCGKTQHVDIGDHTEEHQITFDKWLASSNGDLAVETSPGSSSGTTLTGDDNYVTLTTGYYYLSTTADNYDTSYVESRKTIKIQGKVTICLNGKTLQSTAENKPVFLIERNGELTLTDCGSAGKVTHASGVTGSGVEVNGGKFNLYGGSITKNTAANGGGVYVGEGGTFNMYGTSSITDNTATKGGGGVYVSGGTFNMYGGEIAYNKSEGENSSGGGVYVVNGTFTMSGGTISGNKAESTNGADGGVGVYNDATFTMSGGTISGNQTKGQGGGVGVYSRGTFTMNGGTIGGTTDGDANKAAKGGGVYVGNYGTFTMNGEKTSVSGNKAKNGGGVYVYSGTFNMNDGTIGGATAAAANTATNNGGGVYVEGGKFEMNGPTTSVSGNTATTNGGGVYVEGGTFTMHDGTIGGTIADAANTADQGGGVYVSSGTFTMSGGSITGNDGNGVFVHNNAATTFTVSGAPTVMGNTRRGADSNVFLVGSQTITIGGTLNEGASIGVTRGAYYVIAKNVSTDYSGIFFSDNTQYKVEYDKTNSQLVLATKSGGTTNPPVTTEHKHCLCGKTHTAIGDHQTAQEVTFATELKQVNGQLTMGSQPWSAKSITINGSTPNCYVLPAGSYYLGSDLALDASIYISKNVQLCLNGNSIISNGDNVGRDVVIVDTDSSDAFTLANCRNGGSITHATGKNGCGVYMNGNRTKFNMYGGIITGNNSAGVNVTQTNTFNMYGGSITNNSNGYGGGVYNGGTVNMYGGEISDNTASNKGGGVYMAASMENYQGGILNVSGSAKITDNTVNGVANNVYLPSGKTIAIGTGSLSGTIGVTTEPKPAAGKPVKVIADTTGIIGLTTHVVSDDNAYETAVKGNTIVLQVVGDTGGETTQPVLVSEITLNTDSATLKVGDTETLTATVTPENATKKDVIWTSSNTGVATVENGTVTAVKAGTTTITATAADGSGKSATCTVTVTGGTTPSQPGGSTGGNTGGSSSSGGSSSGGSGSYDSNPIIKTETKNNTDGSTTKTETRKDGSVTQTTTGKDGSVSKTETKKDGSSVTENKAADGSTGTVKTDKNGQTEAKTALSNKAIEDAKKSGEPVKAPVEVEAARNSNTAPTVKVELPGNAGKTEVEIPVSNATAGTVAVLVHPDGTEEILKASVPTENGIRLTVDGSATVKIIDNSKDFVDTRNHWAREEIDFVSARELVNGMSDTIYAPNASATRAQLWTILARQNDADLNGGNTWYEKAQLWSKDKGISDGTEPNAAINRAQMVTMLWRTMGQPAATDKVSFADVPAGSYYAQAVAWAVESGITTGVGGGRFDPTATCTRAQIAAFLTRLYAEK